MNEDGRTHIGRCSRAIPLLYTQALARPVVATKCLVRLGDVAVDVKVARGLGQRHSRALEALVHNHLAAQARAAAPFT